MESEKVEPKCSFCLRTLRPDRLIEGPTKTFICPTCLENVYNSTHQDRETTGKDTATVKEVHFAQRTQVATNSKTQGNAICSFCAGSMSDEKYHKEGPHGVFICSDCVEFCHNAIQQDSQPMDKSEIDKHATASQAQSMRASVKLRDQPPLWLHQLPPWIQSRWLLKITFPFACLLGVLCILLFVLGVVLVLRGEYSGIFYVGLSGFVLFGQIWMLKAEHWKLTPGVIHGVNQTGILGMVLLVLSVPGLFALIGLDIIMARSGLTPAGIAWIAGGVVGLLAVFRVLGNSWWRQE